MLLTGLVRWSGIRANVPVFLLLCMMALPLVQCVYADIVYPASFGGAGNDTAASIRDANGNRFFIGSFDNAIDVDPGPGVVTLSGYEQNKKFISKLDSAGNFLWAKKISGPYSAAMNINSAGHVFITGIFFGTVDFDPGPNVQNITSLAESDIYLLELDNNGDFVKVSRIGSTGSEEVYGITIDSSDAIYLSGFFSQAMDFDPGMGVANLPRTSQNFSAFILKLDAAGNYVWAKELGANGGDTRCYSLAVDGNGNIFAEGFYSKTADFDPGPAVATLVQGNGTGSSNAFISKLDTNGNFIWALAVVPDASNSSRAMAGGVAFSGSGDIYMAGSFSGQVDLDPGIGEAAAVSAGGTDVFLIKLDADGNYLWSKTLGGSGYDWGGVVLDHNDNPYLYGAFIADVDFDPGVGVEVRRSAGDIDAYILKLDADGNYLRATTWGGVGADEAWSVNFDAAGNILSTGLFSGIVDFDLDKFSANYLSSSGGQDVFIATFDVDADNDGYADLVDNFPGDKTRSGDRDNDGIDNLVDVDNDNDGMSDDYEIQYGLDPLNNMDAAIDEDWDSLTNLQEYLKGTSPNNPDSDGDTFYDATDLFPLDPNDYLDFDNDGVGDNADVDDDNDGVADVIDNCPHIVNIGQLDSDSDGYGNACDALPMNPSESRDSDGDGIGDNHDNCALAVNPDQKNIDGDESGDACDNNSDADGTSDADDNCPRVVNGQQDSDNNGIGDACEITKFGFYRELMGSAIAMMDMDKDGYSDVIVSSPGAAVSFSGKVLNNVGVVQVISGATGLIDKIYFGAGKNAHFGVAVAGVPDRTGDGMPDLLIGEPFSDVATTVSGKSVVIKRAGSVSLYSGANGALIKVLATGSESGEQFGAALALGNVNADGVADLVVGSPMANVVVTANGKSVTLKKAGRVSIFNGVNNKLLYTRAGSQSGEHFGAAVAVDGKHQILVGAPEHDVSVTVGAKVTRLVDAGSAQIFDGASDSTPAVSTLYGMRKSDRLGAAISSFRSDINNDGADDWAVGIPGVPDYVITDCHGYDENYYCNEVLRGDAGAVLVLSGNQAEQIKFYMGYTNSVGKGSRFGSAIAADGDIGRDQVNDLMVGAPALTVPYETVYQMKDSGMVTGFSGKRVGSGYSGGYQ